MEPNSDTSLEKAWGLKTPAPTADEKSPLSRWEQETSDCEPWNAVGEVNSGSSSPHATDETAPNSNDADSILSVKGSSKVE